jgi:hypothetical protein
MVDTEAAVTKKLMFQMRLQEIYFTTTLRNGPIAHEFDGGAHFL